MTQHHNVEDTLQDVRTMRRLMMVVGCFIAFTAALAVGVGIVMG